MTLLLSCLLLKAQDPVIFVEDSLQLNRERNFQLYIAPAYSVNQFVGTGASFAGIHLGLISRDRIDVNVSYSKIVDNFKKQIIFPSLHTYDQTNYGLHGQYSFFNKSIRPHVGLGVQYGVVSWKPENNSNDTFTDHVYIYNVFLGVKWLINRTFALQANAGYNFTQDVEIIGLESNDYEGFKADVQLKIRILNF
ncbi:MAG: hypothetical protein KAR17_16735 [Cyclobacteriaceae bacterium]|nr:hypothetical protein [Cyclobacteriaceae bacterium]